jgi:hypothetical protein
MILRNVHYSEMLLQKNQKVLNGNASAEKKF